MKNGKKHCNKVNKAAEAAKGAPKFKGGEGNTLPFAAVAIVIDGVERDKSGLDETITAESVVEMGERVAVKALKTCFTSGKLPNEGDKMGAGYFLVMYRLYTSLIGDIVERKHDISAPLSDGYDVASVAITFLSERIGKRLSDKTDTDETDRNGNPISLLKACFRAVNRYIMGERRRLYKRVYLKDFENGAYIPTVKGWRIDDAETLKRVKKYIDEMRLSRQEYNFLKYRLCGYSLEKIAKLMSVKRDTLNAVRSRVKAKAEKIGLFPSV